MLNYKIVGEGKTVVFIHGFLESFTMWEEFKLEKFPFRSVLIDLPGHGLSGLNKQYEDLLEIAQEVKDFLLSLNITEFDIIGHSLGGYVAIELHKLLPVKGKLILFHSNFWDDGPEKRKDRNRVIEVVKRNKSLFLNEAIPNLFLESFRQTAFVSNLLSETAQILVESIILYTELMRDRKSNEKYCLEQNNILLVIQGDFDAIIPKARMQAYDKQMNVEYTAAGHMGHVEDREKEFDLISDFFSDFTNQKLFSTFF